MKKILLVLTSVIVLLTPMGGTVAYANSAAPIISEDCRGIVFENNDKVKIVNEVLDIDFNADQTANVTATYNMKNITSESLSIENMFLYPLDDDIAREIKVQRNGVDLDYEVEYFGNSMNDIDFDDDWETILSENEYNSQPFGDGSGFFEYTLNADKGFKFVPSDYYFSENDFMRIQDSDELITPINESEFKIITRQELELEAYEYTTVELDNIYEYLEDYYTAKGYDELYANALSDFVLCNVGSNEEVGDYESLYCNNLNDYYGFLVGALLYNVDFAPNEELELVVQYDYSLGSDSYRQTQIFSYYLTPAKYWQDFGEIEINVNLNEDFPRLDSSSLDFDKIDKLTYQYISDELPNEELYITAKTSVFESFKAYAPTTFLWVLLSIGVYLIPILLLAGIIIVTVIIVKRKRKKKIESKI
jgi:hypothetical protein